MSTVTFRLRTTRHGFLHLPSPGGVRNVDVTKRPPSFIWIVTKHPSVTFSLTEDMVSQTEQKSTTPRPNDQLIHGLVDFSSV